MRSLRPAALIGALALGVSSGLITLSPANAAVVGTATLSALNGNADTLLSVSTSGPCASPATKVKVRADGFGFPATGQAVYAPQTFGFSTSSAMSLQLSSSFFTYANANATALVGKYDIKVQCVNGLGGTVYDEYESAMYWSTPGNNVANVANATYSTTAPPEKIIDPTVSGTAVVGATLACNQGTWTGATTYARAWLRDGVVIAGSTGTTRANTSADFGKSISCRVTASNGASAASADSAAVVVGTGTFVSLKAPSISGTVKVGSKLTASVGTWTPAVDAYVYRWLRSGASILGATKSTYIPTSADRGTSLSVRITVTAIGVTSTSKTSAARTVAAGTFKVTKSPTVKGTVKVGRTLTAGKGTWSPSPSTYSYQWQRGSSNIKGATKSTYKVTKKDKGKKIRVKVTVAKSGYTNGVKTSASRTAS